MADTQLRRRLDPTRIWIGACIVALLAGGASYALHRPAHAPSTAKQPAAASHAAAAPAASAAPADQHLLAGMPPPTDAHDVYAAAAAGKLDPRVAGFPQLVYVPNSGGGSVDVIDPRSFRVVRRIAAGTEPQHVVPSYDLRTLWVTSDRSNTLTAIDPRTGRATRTVAVDDPYNLYFTPDGRFAIVVAERNQRLDFRDPQSMRLRGSLPVRCEGIDHIDFTADGRFLLASCEFSGKLAVVNVATHHLVGTITLPGVQGRRMRAMSGSEGRLVPARDGGGGPDGMGMPQDVRLSPDGRTFYAADMMSNGVWLIDAQTWRVRSFLHTGAGAHGLYFSRDSRSLFVTNRGEGSISVVGADDGRLHATWHLPGGGSPDMGGLSSDGTVLWLSGRYHSEVYAISTRTGRLLRRIPVGASPHGLSIFPQPGRYSLGHTGTLR